ncbi:MAG TPA: hypothetical protein VK210_13525 [Terriglobia bacterium]|nr:hypothetical protein [Terriglobia bacterium]
MQSVNKEMGSWLPRIGLQLSNWFERWFPDAFALATVAVAIVFAACLANGSGVMQTAHWNSREWMVRGLGR